MGSPQSLPFPSLVSMAAYHTGHNKQPQDSYQADNNNAQCFHDLHTFFK
jgi:hypothetical protein